MIIFSIFYYKDWECYETGSYLQSPLWQQYITVIFLDNETILRIYYKLLQVSTKNRPSYTIHQRSEYLQLTRHCNLSFATVLEPNYRTPLCHAPNVNQEISWCNERKTGMLFWQQAMKLWADCLSEYQLLSSISKMKAFQHEKPKMSEVYSWLSFNLPLLIYLLNR